MYYINLLREKADIQKCSLYCNFINVFINRTNFINGTNVPCTVTYTVYKGTDFPDLCQEKEREREAWLKTLEAQAEADAEVKRRKGEE